MGWNNQIYFGYEWEPTKSILAKYATYKNLRAKKKEQQQAAANEDTGD